MSWDIEAQGCIILLGFVLAASDRCDKTKQNKKKGKKTHNKPLRGAHCVDFWLRCHRNCTGLLLCQNINLTPVYQGWS